MLILNQTRGLLLITCAIVTFASTGCRSVPGMKMFARKSEPSAEALAGTGPSTTYPAPPSASATPEAIASVAGGTAVPATVSKPGSITSPGNLSSGTAAQVAGYNLQNSYGVPSSTSPPSSLPKTNTAGVNMAAAQANGVYGNSSYGVPSATTDSKPVGYAFGSTGSPMSTATNGVESGTSPSYLPPKTSYALPSRSTPTASAAATSAAPAQPAYSTPPSAPTTFSMSSGSPSPARAAASSPAGGFTLPSGAAAPAANSAAPRPSMFAMPGTSGAAAAITPPAASAARPATTFDLPAASSPDFSTAAVKPSNAPSSVVPASGSTYMPGSTGKASGYPTGGESPTTSGSFYR